MRVAVLLEQCLAPVPGGIGRYSREVAQALAETAPAGSSVAGWTAWHRDPAAAGVPGVLGPRRLPLPRRPLIGAWARRVGPGCSDADVVHAPTLLVPPRRGVPLVVTMHDAVPWTHPETLTARGVAWHRAMGAAVVRDADRVVVPTRAVAAEVAEVLPLGDRVTVIGEGVSTALALPPDADRRAAALGLPGTGYLLSLATLEPRKALDVLLATLAHPGAPPLPLLVVGQPGWGGVDPLATAAGLGLPPGRVRVLGRLPDADLAVVLARARVLVAPSRAEGFGLPVLEAMAAGVPVVSSDAPALVEVGGGATRVVPREDTVALARALAEVCGDAALRDRMAAAGLVRAAAFSWAAAARSLWALYAEVLAG